MTADSQPEPSAEHQPVPRSRYRVWTRGLSAAVVAGVAAYSSYGHQRLFALEAGADVVTAAIWPLSVDGLAILSSIGLLDRHPGRAERARRLRWALRLSFLLSVVVSLAANVAAAPELTWQAVLVAGWPPLALLLAVDLVMHGHAQAAPVPEPIAAAVVPVPVPVSIGPVPATAPPATGTLSGATPDASSDKPDTRTHPTSPVRKAADASDGAGGPDAVDEAASAEEVMWGHYEREWARGRAPSGAELDRVAGTRTYGRAVLARWRREGRIPLPPSPEGAAEHADGGGRDVRPVMVGGSHG